MRTMQWLQHFRASVDRPREVRWDVGVQLDAELRDPVIRSLQTFQRGLTSSAVNLRTKVRQQCEPEYAECVDLYVREKSVHSDLLMRVLWTAESGPRKRLWVDFMFRHLRRRFDWAREVMVILTAEMASMPFFRVLANNAGDPLVKEVLEIVLEDQAYHLGFHIDHLRDEMHGRSNLERLALQQAWGGLFASTLSVVMADNRTVFQVLEYDKLAFWTDAWNLFSQIQTGLNGSQHLAALLGRDPRLKFAL